MYHSGFVIKSSFRKRFYRDIFSRGFLTNREREIATIAALSALEGVDPQLQAHIAVGKHNGLTQEQVEEITRINSSNTCISSYPGAGRRNSGHA